MDGYEISSLPYIHGCCIQVTLNPTLTLKQDVAYNREASSEIKLIKNKIYRKMNKLEKNLQSNKKKMITLLRQPNSYPGEDFACPAAN